MIDKLAKHKTIFVTGIDTDAGKTYATAWLAKLLMDRGRSVATQKFIQTGCVDESEDIVAHREILGIPMLPEDMDRTTAPIVFTYPASAQLAAKIDGREIDLNLIDESKNILNERYDNLFIEGAGGLMVPITDTFFAIDYIATRNLPVVLVTNSKLGSINHTILSLEALAARNIQVVAVVFNHHFDNDQEISEDTYQFIRRYIMRNLPEALYIDLPSLVNKKR